MYDWTDKMRTIEGQYQLISMEMVHKDRVINCVKY